MSRRTVNHCFWASGAGLCALVFSACSSLGGGARQSELANNRRLPSESNRPAGGDPERIFARMHLQGSPYTELPRPQPAPVENPADIHIHQAIYPPSTDHVPLPHDPKMASSGPETLTPTAAHAASRAGEKLPAEPTLLAALRCFLEKRPGEAVTLLREYDRANQELLLCLLPLAVRLAGTSLDRTSPEELTAVGEQLRSMEQPLRPRMELVMDKLCFCEAIRGFGDFKPLPPGHHGFQAPARGRPGELVQIYVELSNLSTVLRDGHYHTRLASSIKIRSYPGQQPIWQREFIDDPTPLQSERHDFYKNYMFYVPHLPAGRYKLYVEVVDVPSGRKAVKCLDFQVTLVPDQDS